MPDSMLAGFAADGDGFELPAGLLGAAVVVAAAVATPGVGRGPAVVGVALEAACQPFGQQSINLQQTFWRINIPWQQP